MKTQVKALTFFAMAVAAALSFGTGQLHAQDRPPQGGFDIQQMRQRMMEQMRTQLEVKDDAEWLIISNRVQAVTKARRSLGLGGGPPGGMGGPPPGGRNGVPGQDGQAPGGGGFGPPGGSGGGPPGGMGGFNREPDPELDALRKAVEGKASATELKARLADLREARKKKLQAFEKAQDELRQVLSVRQEAIAATLGLL